MTSVCEITRFDDVADTDALRNEIDYLDQQILAAVKRRSELSQLAGRRQLSTTSARAQQRHELAVLQRFRELGPEGRSLGMALLRLGRGRTTSRIG
ncbi:chorismate mutase [Antrihabitans cavernicola]|uniref:Chorismate mutase n=1 Tax=Antrihabitans cavernicola TaxID=2495913 RepID=A0A5A7S5K9_9NOCA|nr:chorismate mutase [Spelaeibacter cavernicola]KAA0017064.1 chorismate mutase [Spelaeibacter cavernicola]